VSVYEPTDRIDFAEALDRINATAGERFALGYQRAAEQRRRFEACSLDNVRNVIKQSDRCWWFSANPTTGTLGGRGAERHVTCWADLYADFDVKPAAFKSLDDALACVGTPRNDGITMYGDGVINEHPPGVVCLITPVENPRRGYWHPTIEIDLADLCRRFPWINFQKTDAEEQK
jgi:hypothetical protein